MSGRTSAEVRQAAVAEFVHSVVTASLNRQLHAPDSPFVLESLQAMVDALQRAEAAGVDMPLRLQFSDDRIHFDGVPQDGPSLQAGSLLRRCAERDIAEIAFAPGLSIDEANRGFDLLLLSHNRDALSRENRDQALQALGIRHVRVTSRTPGDPGDRRSALAEGPGALHRYQELADCLQQNHVRAHRDQALAVDLAAGMVERTLDEFEHEPSLLLSLASQDNIDRFTVGHSVRVALLALQVARTVGATRDHLVDIGTAALLHDIGKSKVPQEILFKQSRLDEEEWQWMAQHPRLGAQLLLEQGAEIDPYTVGAAFCHHMGPNGEGYPRPALQFAPSGISRLVRVCDVFEALTAVRPYKRALTPIEAYAVMFRNESGFDPRWLRRFVRTLGLFPTGTRVVLDDGAEALVTAQGERADRPVVRLLTGPGRGDLPAGAPERIVVGEPLDGRVRTIVEISAHDRSVAVPPLDDEEPAYLTQTPAHACLPAMEPRVTD